MHQDNARKTKQFKDDYRTFLKEKGVLMEKSVIILQNRTKRLIRQVAVNFFW